MNSRVALALLLLAAALCCLPLHAATYYVSQSIGDDSWPGTEAHPWKTLWRASHDPDGAVHIYQPGDQILFRRGDTWDGSLDPKNGELILEGSANIRAHANKSDSRNWITVGAYPTDQTAPRPHFTNPGRDTTPGLIDWSDLINWCNDLKNAAHRPQFVQYLDPPYGPRNYVRIAIRIGGNGWKVQDLDISRAEVGIALFINGNWWNAGDGYWLERIYLHDLQGIAWPKHPNYAVDPDLPGYGGFGISPDFAAIQMANASNVTIRECAIVGNTHGPNGVADPFLGGDGIQGNFYTALFENLYLDSIYSGGFKPQGSSIEARNITLLNGQKPDCWFGPVPWNICFATGYVADNCEVAYTYSGPHTADENGFHISENTNVKVQNCFIHHCQGSAFEFNVGSAKQQDILIENNVTYNNGQNLVYYPGDGTEFAGDCLPWPLEHYTDEGDITFSNNRIHRTASPRMRLHCYASSPPVFFDDYTYYETHANYRYSNRGNIDLTTYDPDYVVPDPANPGYTNIATPGYPGFSVSVSSNEAEVCKLTDGDPLTSWNPAPTDERRAISLRWSGEQSIDKVRLRDRKEVGAMDPNTGALHSGYATRNAILDFSNGDRVNVYGGILDNGAVREVRFAEKSGITWVNLQISRWEGSPGIAELQVFSGPDLVVPEWPAVNDEDVNCDLESYTGSAKFLRGAFGSSTDPGNNIDWGQGDWAVGSGDPVHGKYLHVNFTPVRWYSKVPPQGDADGYHPIPYAVRTFTLPRGKRLRSIDVFTPNASFSGYYGVSIEQPGAPKGGGGTNDHDGQWHTVSLGDWPPGQPASDVVRITLYAEGPSDPSIGIHSFRFDNIRYDD